VPTSDIVIVPARAGVRAAAEFWGADERAIPHAARSATHNEVLGVLEVLRVLKVLGRA